MDRQSPRPLAGRPPTGLFGMVALVVAIESFLAARAPDFTGDGAGSWRWAASSARVDAPGSAILCLGDSLVKYGVVPRVIEAQTGRKACNLAVIGGRPAHSYFLLRRALDAGARPEALVVDAHLVQEEPFENPQVWAELADPFEAAEMAWNGGLPGFFAHYAAAWALPSVRARSEIRKGILAAIRGERSDARSLFELNERHWRANRGASIVPAEHQLAAATVGFLENPPAEVPGSWRCRPQNAVYMDKFLALAAGRGIPVFWVYPPQYRMLDRYFDRPNWAGLYRRFALDHQARYPNLTVIDALHADYDRPAMVDVSHLNRRGAVAFSLALGAILRDRLAAGAEPARRRIELPPFREPPAEAPVEDYSQSAIAVRQAVGSARR